ncbi:MAG: hypothetical protein H0W87_06405, partial [Actinobacteria bacterium]|nr:hypothetical protein [Actinomycetota bacterium]
MSFLSGVDERCKHNPPIETEFEDLVGEALDSLPEDIARLMSNVAVVVE